jgi:DNA-binding MarR family transcriptional regulator
VDQPPAEDGLQDGQLIFLLGMAFQLLLGQFVRRMDAAGYSHLRPIHGLVFQSLLAGATTSSEIAATLGVTKQAAGQIVNDLEVGGYLRRTDHPEGGRRRQVVLTDEGHRHLRTTGELLRQLEDEVAHGLADRSTASLRAQLATVIRQLAGEQLPPFRPLWN